MIFAAMTVEIIEKRLHDASIWYFIGAALWALGFIHSYAWDFKNTRLSLSSPVDLGHRAHSDGDRASSLPLADCSR